MSAVPNALETVFVVVENVCLTVRFPTLTSTARRAYHAERVDGGLWIVKCSADRNENKRSTLGGYGTEDKPARNQINVGAKRIDSPSGGAGR